MERTYMQVNEMQIRGLLEATKREGVEDLCCAMHDNGFFRVSCQPHHDFDGGTAWYSLEVVLRIVKQNRFVLPIDSMIIVAFLHELHRIEGGDDSTLSGSRALATLSKICPQFKLKQSEYEAILWHSYTQKDLKRMGEQAQAALNNPLRQALRSAKLYCIKNPMDIEELEAAIAGKRRPRRNVIAIPSHGHAYRHELAKEDSSETIREKTIRPHREKVPSPDSNAYALSKLSIMDLAIELQRRAKEEELTNEDIKYIREIQDALPSNRYNIYKKDVDDSIKIAMNNELDKLCRLKRYGPYELARVFSDEKNAKIFDFALDYKEIYKQLKKGYGSDLNFAENTLQKMFGQFGIKFT